MALALEVYVVVAAAVVKYAFLSHSTAALLTIQPRLFLVCCEKRQRGEWVQLLPGKAQEE